MASAWREKFRKDRQNRFDGTYKGVPFFIRSHSLSSGRRIVDHVFPYQDMAFTEDLGRKQRKFSVEIYVIGDDYFTARDNLIDALESEGAGVLIHPYYGTKTVEAESFEVTESSADGGMASFSVTFHETGRKPAPDVAVDPISAVTAAAAPTDESLIADMDGFDVSFLSDYSLKRTVAMVDRASSTIQSVADQFPGNFGIAELGYSIRSLKQTIGDLISRPETLARTTSDAFQILMESLNFDGLTPQEDERPDADQRYLVLGRQQREAFKPALDLERSVFINEESTPTKIKEAENERLYLNLIKGHALTKLSLVAVQSTYATFDEAIRERDYIVSEIEKILDDPLISDATYSSFMDLKAAVISGIPNGISEESRISYVTINESVPSIVLAYELYGNLALEQDLILRNRVKHPGFVTAGQIEVVAGG